MNRKALLTTGATFALSWALLAWWTSVDFATVTLVTILLHECGHALAARWVGGQVHSVLVTPLFGLTVATGWSDGESDALYLLGGGGFGLGVSALCLVAGDVLGGSWAVPLQGWAAFGAAVNLFNLLPFYFLDGGALVSRFLGARLGSLTGAVVVALPWVFVASLGTYGAVWGIVFLVVVNLVVMELWRSRLRRQGKYSEVRRIGFIGLSAWLVNSAALFVLLRVALARPQVMSWCVGLLG